jgi:tetratricopeptide (TPR) repeat protein
MTDREPTNGVSGQQATASAPAAKIWFAPTPWLLAMVLVVVTVVVYLPAMRAGFIWDDDDHLTANPAVASPNGLEYIWTSLAISRYYPLTLTDFWVQRRLWGLHPMPYHVVNILFHAANGVLVFFLLRRLRIPAAWLAAMVWAVHPVNVESVAWITELKNTQSGLFFFLSLLLYLKFAERTRQRGYVSAFWYALAFVCGMAAMLSKASTVVLPLALLLGVWWQRGHWERADAAQVAPFFGLAWLISGLTIIEQRGQIAQKGTHEWSLGVAGRIIVAGKALWFYMGKVLWPVNLVFVYPRWQVVTNSIESWLPVAGAVVGVVVLYGFRRQPWARAGAFGLGFFVTGLLPALGFFDVYYFRFSFVGDHFQYLASLGVVALAVSGLASALDRWGLWLAPVGNGICAAVLMTLAVFTWRQTHVYHDAETLWRETLARNPSAWMPHYNLGKALSDQGRTDEAIAQYREALRLKPDYAEAHSNLGSSLGQQGKLTEACEHWEAALRIKPDMAEAHYNLGFVAAHAGRTGDAIQHWEATVRIKPKYPELQYNLGILLQQAGRNAEAIEHYRAALDIDPHIAEARYNLGTLLEQAGNVPETIRCYERALQLKPDFPEAQNSLARLLATISLSDGGAPSRAVELAQRVCAPSGNRTAGYLDTLAIAYAATGRFDDAVATAQKAVELARADGKAQLANDIQARLELYRSGHPYHPTSPAAVFGAP